jgi:hypothetical protein
MMVASVAATLTAAQFLKVKNLKVPIHNSGRGEKW